VHPKVSGELLKQDMTMMLPEIIRGGYSAGDYGLMTNE
jgi:hypothetical protein